MRNLQNLIPGFLRKIDTRLLEHHPQIWVTRIHYVAFFGGIVAVLLAVRSAFVPIALSDLPDVYVNGTIVAIPALVLGALWTIRQAVFVSGRETGMESPGTDLMKVVVYTGIFGLFILITPATSLILQTRIGNAVSFDEFSNDIRSLDEGAAVFFGAESGGEHSYYGFGDMLYISEPPAIEAIPVAGEHFSPAEANRRLQEFLPVFSKYGGDANAINSNEVLSYYNRNENYFMPYEEERKVRRSIAAISDAKNGNSFIYQHEAWQGLSFVSLLLGIAMVIFSRVKWNYFIVSVVAIAIMGICGAIAEFGLKALTGVNSDGQIFLLSSFIVLVFMGFQGISVFSAQKFTWIRTISLISLNMVFPFIPLYFMGAMEIMNVGGWHDDQMWVGLWGGVALYLLAGVHFFKAALTRLDAIPK